MAQGTQHKPTPIGSTGRQLFGLKDRSLGTTLFVTDQDPVVGGTGHFRFMRSLDEAKTFETTADVLAFSGRRSQGGIECGACNDVEIVRITEESRPATRRVVPLDGAKQFAITFKFSIYGENVDYAAVGMTECHSDINEAQIYSSISAALMDVQKSPKVNYTIFDHLNIVGIEEVPGAITRTWFPL